MSDKNETVKTGSLTNETVKTLSYQNIYFVSIAENGAMGDGGGVVVISLEHQQIWIRYGNYAYGELNMQLFGEVFPPLQQLDFENPKDIGEWHHLYMGAGNHLLVRNDVYENFNHYNIYGSISGRRKFSLFSKIRAVLSPLSSMMESMMELYQNYIQYAVQTLQKRVNH